MMVLIIIPIVLFHFVKRLLYYYHPYIVNYLILKFKKLNEVYNSVRVLRFFIYISFKFQINFPLFTFSFFLLRSMIFLSIN